jgi:hypothetical protein
MNQGINCFTKFASCSLLVRQPQLPFLLQSIKNYSGFFRSFLYGFCLLLLTVISGCQPTGKKKINRAFYYWKTTFELNPHETEKLQKLNVHKLYVRYFDVDWNSARNEAQPLAPLVFRSSFPAGMSVIPTVYITNKTLQEIPEILIPKLAGKILNQIGKVNKAGKLMRMEEVQLDCDWTETTREKYFKLVKTVKEKLLLRNAILSVTIRLHQVKYARRTGIPPANRGMLMFYNMGKIKAGEESNSIYEPETAARYLKNFEQFPLPLDIALPAFSWAILSRQGKPIALLNNLRLQDLQENKHLKAVGNNKFEVLKLQFLQQRYLYPGDELKLEEITPEQTRLAARQIRPYLKGDTLDAALFHFDSKNLEPYTLENLEEIYHSLL